MKRIVIAIALALTALGVPAAAASASTASVTPHTRIVLYVHGGRTLAWVDESGGGHGRLTELESDNAWHTYTGTYHVTISALTFTTYQGGARWVFRFPYHRTVW